MKRVPAKWKLAPLVACIAGGCGPSAKGTSETDEGSGTAASMPTDSGGASHTSMASGDDASDGTSGTGPMFDPQPCEPDLEPESPFYPSCSDPWTEAPETFVKCHPEAVCDSWLCDADNCGECGHRCLSGCSRGLCGSKSSECVRPEDGLTTCAQVCAREGALCEARTELSEGESGCTRGYAWIVDEDLTDDFRIPKCPVNASTEEGGGYEPVGCDEPIEWDHGTTDSPQTGVRCCCDGDLP